MIKVWNPITGHCQATIATQHRKTITSLLPVIRSDYLDDGAKVKQLSWRIMTSSLDGVLQFHSWDATLGKSLRHSNHNEIETFLTL